MNVLIRTRITCFVHGVILPVVLFVFSSSGLNPSIDAPWQSGKLADYVSLLLQPSAWWPFVPALLFSLVSMTTWAIAPSLARQAWLRLGIYTGVILALHYLVLLLIIFHVAIVLGFLAVWTVWHLLMWWCATFAPRRIHIWHIMALTTAVALLIAAYSFLAVEFFRFPALVIVATLIATPALNFVVYCSAAFLVYRDHMVSSTKTKRFMIAGFLAWLVGWLACWRLSILTMLDEYSKLPLTQPNCYLSNAAAYAHPLLTGAKVRGETTMCMRRLKFIELVFKAAWPCAHTIVRQHYDRWCPALAERCRRNIWLATTTRIGLLPIEWLAEVMRLILRIPSASIQRIYESKIAS